MLERLGINNFKSYRSAELRLAPLTVLIGTNASGKSNAIEALRLLSWIAQSNKLGAIRFAVQEADRSVRGKVSDLGFRGQRRFSFVCVTDDAEWNQLKIELELGQDDELYLSYESITGTTSTVPLYEVVAHGKGHGSDIRVAYNNFARGGRKPQITCTDQMAIFLQLQSSARFEGGHRLAQRLIPKVTSRYQYILSEMLFLDPQPNVMRSYSFKNESKLAGDGSNISGVLFNLCQERSTKNELLSLIRSLPEQDIEDISFVETPRGEVMLSLTETFGQKSVNYDAPLLSDGTLRALSVAAALLSAPKESLVIIEEIDNGVHPSRARHLLEHISRLAKNRGLRVLISSHNPALLDALPDEFVPHVVFCYRSAKDGSSQLTRLQDVPDYPELIAQGSVGHLMTEGLLEKFVKTHPGSQARRDQAIRWAQSLRREVS